MRNAEPVVFADDTNLFSNGSDAISLQDEITDELPFIVQCFQVNKLSINITKAHFMCSSAKDKTTPCISIQIDGEAIAKVFKLKFLCVVIDNELSWMDHVSFV